MSGMQPLQATLEATKFPFLKYRNGYIQSCLKATERHGLLLLVNACEGPKMSAGAEVVINLSTR